MSVEHIRTSKYFCDVQQVAIGQQPALCLQDSLAFEDERGPPRKRQRAKALGDRALGRQAHALQHGVDPADQIGAAPPLED